MIDLVAIKNSENLYQKVKQFFGLKKYVGCVIEISEKPMNEWRVHHTENEESMVQKRRELNSKKTLLVNFYEKSENTYLYFYDGIITKIENLRTREVIVDNIENFEKSDFKLIMKEYSELKKSLQKA
jgi:hypothetical protein